MMQRRRTRARGMTFVEMVLCLFILSVLATAAFPLVENGQTRERELRLASELRVLRKAIDRYYEGVAKARPDSTEAQRYPRSLEELVEKRLLRRIPIDPMTGRSDWLCLSTSDGEVMAATFHSDGANVFDVRSQSLALSRRGRAYRLW